LDVVQQGLLRAWMVLAGGTEVRNFQAWLYTIVRNAAYSEQARGADDRPAWPGRRRPVLRRARRWR
jgi:DNA-directed RNA polymerase specialized sigma24 family protein